MSSCLCGERIRARTFRKSGRDCFGWLPVKKVRSGHELRTWSEKTLNRRSQRAQRSEVLRLSSVNSVGSCSEIQSELFWLRSGHISYRDGTGRAEPSGFPEVRPITFLLFNPILLCRFQRPGRDTFGGTRPAGLRKLSQLNPQQRNHLGAENVGTGLIAKQSRRVSRLLVQAVLRTGL